ncbi:hypothetical protein [uncultured Oscillibacter sp.]|uniref:hypothetical protein n=1 Tax=uncultured Oscillibacter sp. TaxID=876091 RepID=UPI0025F74F30|nr:hypothetical protein [uncultured Oscillibacter sp.]
MKKNRSQIFVALLVVAMSTFLTVSAFAADEKMVVEVDGSKIVNYSDVVPINYVHGDDFLGRWEDAEFDNTPTIYPNAIQPQSSSLLFSMTATNVQDFLVTGSNKEFSRGSLSKGYLKITGNLTNSYSSDAFVRIGGCWYDSSSNEFVRDGYSELTADGSYISESISKNSFVPDMMLRGFIKNISGVGSVSGTLHFYNSSN